MTYPTLEAADYDQDYVELRIAAIAKRHNLRFSNVQGDFRAHSAPADLYFLRDGHLNPDGARFVAETLLNFLKSKVINFGIAE